MLFQNGKHRLAKIQPSALLDAMNVAKFKAEDPDQHFTFAYPIEELTPTDFRSDLKKLLRASTSRSVTLFVHGYANSFKDAAFRTAQLSFDLRLERYDTVPVLFSWPSDPSGINYPGAKDRIRSAGNHLAIFLNRLVGATGVGVVHIIAHSMGADVLAVALDIPRVKLQV
uniref:Alpha/beta hydrolase n=1 Tax=uncultured bacterium CSL12 TaxID=1091567 RepID=G4WVI3_9BACT|nr:alpha/beta hydrolase [uncultured bacterium CSL12]